MTKILKTSKTKNTSSKLPIIYWLFFITNLSFVLFTYPNLPNYESEIFRFNGFSAVIWLSVSFFSAVISSYSANYLKGFKYHTSYNLNAFLFTLSVLTLVVSNSIWMIIATWLAMGYFMARLIGVNQNWGEAREALKFTFKRFAFGSALLAAGLLTLAIPNDAFTLSEIMASLDSQPYWLLLVAAILIITASLIQSAIYPFHKWLLSAMTAPTPASALMHAGFVNGSGIILTICAGLIYFSNTFDLLFIIGGLTAIIAQFTKLLQVNVKHKLACSTIAQMGFMIMQCGLGFFNAAIAHLILHGFYKAYLFLSAGEEIKQSVPAGPPKIRIKPLQAVLVGIFSLLGAWMFITLTGKGLNLDSGIFLTLIVAITVGQATYNIVKEKSMGYLKRIWVSAIVFFTGIGMYALFYNGVTAMLSDMPMAYMPLELSVTQVIFGVVFLIGFFMMKLGGYRKIPWLYVTLLNASQPSRNTVLKYKTKGL